MRFPHQTARRIALLAAVIAGPTLAACSTEGPLAPQAPARTAVPGGNQTGFVVGWGVTDGANGAGTSGTSTGRTGAPVIDEPLADTAATVETVETVIPVRKR